KDSVAASQIFFARRESFCGSPASLSVGLRGPDLRPGAPWQAQKGRRPKLYRLLVLREDTEARMTSTRSDIPEGPSTLDGAALERLLVELRPKLHRYCARITGSVIDGEDILQDAIIKAIEALPTAGTIENPEGWMFRIAHNAALDFLR